jgi:DNA-binding response OmpR family regulator
MNILIIEDNPNIAYITRIQLERHGHKVDRFSGTEFKPNFLKGTPYELIIMNTEVFRTYRKIIEDIRIYNKKILILGLSTRGGWQERVEMLKCGADDVIGYPFPVQELEARIDSLQRRPQEVQNQVLKIKDLEINLAQKEVLKKEEPLELRKKEFQLLEYLVKNRGRTITRSELSDHVWDYRNITGSNTIDVHINRLRDKLKDESIIRTVRGFGYTFREPKV